MWFLLAIGCGNPFHNAENVATWANAGSPVGVYALVYEPIAIADGEETFADPLCPAVVDDGTHLSITGGCTDANGQEWAGVASIGRSGGDRSVALSGYGSFSGERVELSGVFDLVEVDAGNYTFHADLVQKGGMTTVIAYDGTVSGGYDVATTWNGHGTVEREGPIAPTGIVEVSTVDEVLDDLLCTGQAASGTTTVEAKGHEAVITYDGATDCDAAQAAKLTVDGEDKGLVEGIACSTGAPAPLWVGLGLGAWVRRRRSGGR